MSTGKFRRPALRQERERAWTPAPFVILRPRRLFSMMPPTSPVPSSMPVRSAKVTFPAPALAVKAAAHPGHPPPPIMTTPGAANPQQLSNLTSQAAICAAASVAGPPGCGVKWRVVSRGSPEEGSTSLNPSILFLLSLGHFVADLSQGALPVISLFLTDKMHLTYFQIGLVSLFFTLSSAFIQPFFGLWSDRRRATWLLPASCLLAGLGLSLTGLVPYFFLLLAVVFLSGVGVAGYHPEASKTAYYASGRHNRGISMAIFSLGGNLGIGLGPLIAYLFLNHAGLKSTAVLFVPGLIMALLFLAARSYIVKATASRRGEGTRPAPGPKARTPVGPVVLLIGYVTVRSWIQAGLIYYLPFYVTNLLGAGKSTASLTLTVYLIAGAVGTVAGGTVADRWGGKFGLLVSMAGSLVCTVLYLETRGPAALAAIALSGAALISTFSTTVVYGQRLMPDRVGLASGLMLGFGVGMGSTGVMLLGLVADRFGLLTTLWIIALFPLIGLPLAASLPIPEEDYRVKKAEASG